MEPSIQFADTALHTCRSNTQSIGGVVPLRSRSRGRKSSLDVGKLGGLEDAVDEDAGLRNDRDFKRSQVIQTSQLSIST